MEIFHGPHAPTAWTRSSASAKRRGFVFPSSEIYGGLRASWDYGPLGVELKNNVKRQWWRRWSRGATTSSASTPASSWPARCGRPAATSRIHRPADRVPVLPQALPRRPPRRGLRGEARPAAGGRPGRHRLPELRHQGRVHRAAAVQRPAQDLPRPGRGRVRPGLPAAGDRAGHLHQLPQRAAVVAQEDPVRHRPDRQVVPQRDHARATSSSAPASSSRWRWSSSSSRAPTRSGTSTGSTTGWRGTPTWASARRTCACTSTRRRSCSHYSKRTVDIEYRFDFPGGEWGELEGVANRTDYDLTAHAKASGQDLTYFDQDTGERYVPVRDRARGRCRPGRCSTFLLDAYTEDEAPNAKGEHGEAHGHAARPAARAGQGRGAAAVPQRRPVARRPATWPRSCASAGTSSSTTPARSAAATAARTRSARRSASPSTSTRSRTRRSPSASATPWRRSASRIDQVEATSPSACRLLTRDGGPLTLRPWTVLVRGRSGYCAGAAAVTTANTAMYWQAKAAMVSTWKISWKPNQRGNGRGVSARTPERRGCGGFPPVRTRQQGTAVPTRRGSRSRAGTGRRSTPGPRTAWVDSQRGAWSHTRVNRTPAAAHPQIRASIAVRWVPSRTSRTNGV